VNNSKRQIVTIGAALLMTVLAVSCGGGGSTPGPSPGNLAMTSPSPSPYTQDLATALAELEGLECPEGADAEVFKRIKQDALRMLIDKYSGKQVSEYDPTNDYVKVREFDWDSGGTYGKLVWIYVNDGDYDQDGIVKIDDITPVAIHYDEDVGDDVNTIRELIDEDD